MIEVLAVQTHLKCFEALTVLDCHHDSFMPGMKWVALTEIHLGPNFGSEHGHTLFSCWEPAIGSTRPKTRDNSHLGVKLGKRTYWLVRYL